jgi:tautomerase-like protein
MPHVMVKLWPGKSEQQKTRLAEAITKNVMDILHYSAKSPCRFRHGRSAISGLAEESLQTRRQKQMGHALQEARLR